MEGVDLEGDEAAVGATDFLLHEVDGDGGVGASIGSVEQLLPDPPVRCGSALCRS